MSENSKLVTYFLDLGLDPFKRDLDGKIPLDYASNVEVEHELRTRMARLKKQIAIAKELLFNPSKRQRNL